MYSFPNEIFGKKAFHLPSLNFIRNKSPFIHSKKQPKRNHLIPQPSSMVNSSPSTPTNKRSSRSLFPLLFTNSNNNSSSTNSSSSGKSNSTSSQNENSPNQLSNNSVNFDVSKYAVQFTEVMEVEDARNHFYDYLTNIALCNETVRFMVDFEEYKNAYFLRFGNRLLQNSSTVNNHSSTTPRNSTGSSLFGRRKSNSAGIQTVDTKSVHSLNFVTDIFSGVVGSSSVAEPYVNAIKISYALASVLMEKYILNGGGLNLPNTVIQKVKSNWETLQNVYEANQWPEEAYHFVTMVELLSPENLFSTVYLAVLTDMKLDQFPRYSRSDFLRNFLLKNGEQFTRAIALDTTTRGRDCRFKTEDFINKTLLDHHIKNSFSLIEDSPYWNCVYEKEKTARYISSTNFMIGKNLKGLKCIKYVHQLPYPRDYVLSIYAASKEVRKKLDPWVLDFKNLAYFGSHASCFPSAQSSPSPSTTTASRHYESNNSSAFNQSTITSPSPRGGNDTKGSQQLSSFDTKEFTRTVPTEEEPRPILRNSRSTPCLSNSPPTSPRSNQKEPHLAFSTVDVPFSIGLGFSQRIFHFLCSLIYDPAIDCFIMYHKTYDPNNGIGSNNESTTTTENGKEPISSDGLTIHYFYKTSDSSTRLVTLVYADLHLPFQSDLYFKLLTKSRGKELREALQKNLPLYEKEWHSHCLSMVTKKEEQTHNNEVLSPAEQADAFVDSLFRVDNKDDFHFYKTLRENMKTFPNRSFYSEYLNSIKK